MNQPRRGDVVFVDFPDKGTVPKEEFDDPHRAIVMQDDSQNKKVNSTIVVPISSRDSKNPDTLTEVLLYPETDPVEHESLAQLRKVSTVSVPGRITNKEEWKAGRASTSVMQDIELKVAYILSLPVDPDDDRYSSD